MEEYRNSEENEWVSNWTRKAAVDFLEYPEEKEHPIRQMIAEITKQTGKTVLDVGCATCNDYGLHKKLGTSYVGLDFTKKFLDRAKKLYPNVEVKFGNALDLPYEDGTFDVVYCKDLLEHLPPDEYKQATREMWRVARKKVMIAFFKAPTHAKTRYKKNKREYYVNRYNKTEITKFLHSLPNIADLKITENIGYNNAALYELVK